jgi:hypothetical protein
MTASNDESRARLRQAALEYHELPQPGKLAVSRCADA